MNDVGAYQSVFTIILYCPYFFDCQVDPIEFLSNLNEIPDKKNMTILNPIILTGILQ